MKRFFRNPIVDTVAKATLIFAGIHIVTLIAYSVSTGTYEALNMFSVIGLTLFFPGIGEGIGYFIAAIIFCLSIYGIVYMTLVPKK